jgi:hypothetical protein
MDPTNKNIDPGKWVNERLKGLARPSGWLPDADLGLVHFHRFERIARRRRLQRTVAVAGLILSILFLSVPATRGIARQLLDYFYMRSPEAVRSTMPRAERPLFIMEYSSPPGIERFVPDVIEARQEAGFEPRLPPMLAEQIAMGLAVLKVGSPIDARITIHVDELTAALKRRGVDGVNVPRDWDGITIGYHLDHSILVAFLGGTLAQSLRTSLVTPRGFPLIDFTEIALQAAGLSPADAHNARNLFADSGGAFSIVPSDAKSRFREVPLKQGHGLLFENDTDEDERRKCSLCPGPHERVLTWTVSDRIYLLRSQTMTVDQVIELANSIH